MPDQPTDLYDADLELLERLSNAYGPTGFEGPVRAIVCEALTPVVDDLDLAARAVSGRGLTIVASLAEDWGVEEEGAGKRVWARLPWSRVVGLSVESAEAP